MREDDKIIAAISLEEDEEVDALDCWDESLNPVGELARVAVSPKEQGKGIAKIMMKRGMDELKARGYKGIHIVVQRFTVCSHPVLFQHFLYLHYA